jgi:hypothetical protein
VTTIEARVAGFALAERNGDVDALTTLLHQDFLGVGPFGFLLDRNQWTSRFAQGLSYTELAVTIDMPVRVIADTAIVVATQSQSGTYSGRPIDGAFRVSLVLTGRNDWSVMAVHMSLRIPPAQVIDSEVRR